MDTPAQPDALTLNSAGLPSACSAMQKKTIRTGIVGSGFSASFHYEALRKVYGTNVEVVGVHSKDAATGQGLCRESRGIRFFESLDALLDEVDAIHVCVPPMAHEPVSVAGLHRDKFVDLRKAADGLFRRRLDRISTGTGPTSRRRWQAALASVDRILAAERRARAGCCMPKTGSTPRRSRKSGRSWKRPAGKSSGFTARKPTAARTRWTMPTRPAAVAAC